MKPGRLRECHGELRVSLGPREFQIRAKTRKSKLQMLWLNFRLNFEKTELRALPDGTKLL